jgi:Lrp/AsnC family transcriptional regulator
LSTFDGIDRKILDLLQEDAEKPIAEIAAAVGLSQTPCWRRIKRMEEENVIRRRVALVDRRQLNASMTVFIAVKALRHAAEWTQAFRDVVQDIPEIMEVHRLTGDTDYLIRLVVPDIERYDIVYQMLTSKLEFSDLSSSISMEELKFTTAVPTKYMAET